MRVRLVAVRLYRVVPIPAIAPSAAPSAPAPAPIGIVGTFGAVLARCVSVVGDNPFAFLGDFN